MSKKTISPIAAVVGAALAGSLAVVDVAGAADNPFGAAALDRGTLLAEGGEGKCGSEGKCGGTKDGGEGKCGGTKDGGEGKCGGTKEGGEGGST